MPNIKSQKKRDKTNKASNVSNSSRKNEIRTAIKKVEVLASEGKKDEANVALRAAISLLDKSAHDGIYAVNTVNRKKAHLQKVVAAIA
ncbi:MAG: 30S ribosomal protein S20 [Bacilli bacterium]|nr:30S ribosomal protein S20 [Bacilli bacterium]